MNHPIFFMIKCNDIQAVFDIFHYWVLVHVLMGNGGECLLFNYIKQHIVDARYEFQNILLVLLFQNFQF